MKIEIRKTKNFFCTTQVLIFFLLIKYKYKSLLITLKIIKILFINSY